MDAQTADPGKLPLIFILITVMIDAMGVGLIIPVMPDLIQEVEGVTLADAAKWGGILFGFRNVGDIGCGGGLGGGGDARHQPSQEQ